MTSYKLTYFDARGRAELCRYMFHAVGKDFDDKRVTHDWPQLKPKTPFGQLPVLEVDDKELAQSSAIARYLAREFGLAGKTSWETAVIDQYMELAGDMFTEMVKAFFEKDEEKKLTLADLAVYNAFDTPILQVPSLLEKFPKLKAHREMVGGVPKLEEYVKNRKQTDI